MSSFEHGAKKCFLSRFLVSTQEGKNAYEEDKDAAIKTITTNNEKDTEIRNWIRTSPPLIATGSMEDSGWITVQTPVISLKKIEELIEPGSGAAVVPAPSSSSAACLVIPPAVNEASATSAGFTTPSSVEVSLMDVARAQVEMFTGRIDIKNPYWRRLDGWRHVAFLGYELPEGIQTLCYECHNKRVSRFGDTGCQRITRHIVSNQDFVETLTVSCARCAVEIYDRRPAAGCISCVTDFVDREGEAAAFRTLEVRGPMLYRSEKAKKRAWQQRVDYHSKKAVRLLQQAEDVVAEAREALDRR